MSGTKTDVKLVLPKWVIGLMLLVSAVLFILDPIAQLIDQGSLTLEIVMLVLFLPAYVLLFVDIGNRDISHTWSFLLIVLPFLGPFIYFLYRDRIKPEEPIVV